jgi:hypothetical protein
MRINYYLPKPLVTDSSRITPCATSSPALPADRFQTVVGCPDLRKAPARARLIGPRPITVTGGTKIEKTKY